MIRIAPGGYFVTINYLIPFEIGSVVHISLPVPGVLVPIGEE
jgi:hypothetical protein